MQDATLKQASNRQLMAMGSREASAELALRKRRVDAGRKVIADMKRRGAAQ